MGIAIYYFCNSCENSVINPVQPFEPIDIGELTPEGWEWEYDSAYLVCPECIPE